jgi:hypothetical protein
VSFGLTVLALAGATPGCWRAAASADAGRTGDAASSPDASSDVSSDGSNEDSARDASADALRGTAGDAGGSDGGPGDGGGADSPAPPPQTLALSVSAVDTTFVTRDHFIASVEMQLAGEPFAEAMGRDLGGYRRDYACQLGVCSPSLYFDPASADDTGQVDLAGYSAAIESYEYSKQPMNNIAFESGAGTSLLFGPVLNPGGATGLDALQIAQAWYAHIGVASNGISRFVKAISPQDPLGWPGLWPTLQPFSSWNPAIQPSNDSGCNLSSDDNRGAKGALVSDVYECDYTSLHLPNRAAQVSMTIGPGASGWTDWKEALWTLNYLQIMHNFREGPVDSVPEPQLGFVGLPGNVVAGSIIPGTYLGSSDIEGFQAGNFIQALDNQAAQWLSQLTTGDGATLGGFASLADALAYNPQSPLRWFPAAIGVTETADPSGFPRPIGYAIASADSHLLDLAGVLGAYASTYALTDLGNDQVGGSQPVRVFFDGDPFPAQNQTPDGQPTLHDRALAMVRVAVVNMARLHVDPATGLFVDDATPAAGGAVTRGTRLSSDVAAYALLSLRTARRALDSALSLYSNTTPDAQGIPTPLDRFPAVDGVPFARRLDQLITGLASTFYDKLTTADGRAFAGWSITGGAGDSGSGGGVVDTGDSLDAHTAAIRGLLIAYLATGAVKYRDRAASVLARLESAFYDPSARVYRATAGDRGPEVTFTPRRFGLLQGALRDSYELVAALPGHDALAALIQDRVARLDKLVLNGWDDRDQDQLIAWPSECAQLGASPDGQMMGRGGLQMAERVLTGESGSLDSVTPAGGTRTITTDREHDCVPEIAAARLPSALANSITFTLTPWSPANQGQIFRNGAWMNP